MTRRTAVTSPQTRLAHDRRRHRLVWRPPALDPSDAQRALTTYRAQRRRALPALAALFALVFGLPLVIHFVPDHLRLIGIPLSWLAVVVIPFPAMAVIAVWQLRRAEREEE